MTNDISLLDGQIIIPAYITLPLPVVILGALLALIGCITLVILWLIADGRPGIW